MERTAAEGIYMTNKDDFEYIVHSLDAKRKDAWEEGDKCRS